MVLDLKPVRGGRWHRFVLALRVAWRDVRRHKGRSALIIALIALPIAGMSAVASLGQSVLATPQEKVLHQLGQTQARFSDLHAQNAFALQDPALDTGYAVVGNHPPEPDFVPTKPRDAIPDGYRVLSQRGISITSSVRRAQVPLQAQVVDALDPAFAGRFTLISGRAPAAADEALASSGLLSRFNLQLGGRLITSAGSFAVVGQLRDAGSSDSNATIFLTPEQVPADIGQTTGFAAGDADYYLVGEKPVSWKQIQQLNTVGVAVLSRAVLLNPPAPDERASHASYAGGFDPSSYYLFGALAGVLALLEVGLLAGAAFAVGAKNQQRSLALLTASGAERGTIRLVVAAGGLWLGATAGILGGLLGAVSAAVTVAIFRNRGSDFFSGVHINYWAIVACAAVGLIAGLVSAVFPAHAVARQAALGALKSGRAASRSSRWPTLIGIVLVTVALAALAAGSAVSAVSTNPDAYDRRLPLIAWLLGTGAVVLVIGLLFLTGWLIARLTTRTSWLPVTLRLAARDSARNQGRTVPAVAAVLAAATMASALMVGAASAAQHNKDAYHWQLNLNQASLYLTAPDTSRPVEPGTPPARKDVDPDAVAATLRRTLDTVSSAVALNWITLPDCINAEVSAAVADANTNCRGHQLRIPEANRCAVTPRGRALDSTDWRCTGSAVPAYSSFGGNMPPFVAGGETELAALLGHEPSTAAREVLARGGIVVTDRAFLTGPGTADFQTVDPRGQPPGDPANGQASTTGGETPQKKVLATVPLKAAVDVPDHPLPLFGVISPETAARLGVNATPQRLLVTFSATPTDTETDRLRTALSEYYGPYSYLQLERGNSDDAAFWLWIIVGAGALITLSAAGITAGLAFVDGRADQVTLAAIGAAPRLRKSLAAAQTLTTASLGSLLGTAAGVLPSAVVVSVLRNVPLVVPWLQLAALLVAVPLVGSAAAWLLTRSRPPMARRQPLA